MKQTTQNSQILFITAGTLTVLGAFGKIFDLKYAPYLFAIGAALLIFVQAKNMIDKWKAELRVQRRARAGFMTSLFLGLASYFMFSGSNSWVIVLLIYALSSFFNSFRGE